MKIIAISKVSGRPDIYSLQLQLMQRLLSPQPTEYICVYSPPRMGKDRSAECKAVCDKYGARFVQLKKVDHSEHWKFAVSLAVESGADMALIVEDDVIPITTITLSDETFGRTSGGALTKQARYIDPVKPDEPPLICMEAERGKQSDNPLTSEHEWFGPWFHYDKGSAFTFDHELKAKDANINAIAARLGAEPFAESCGARIVLTPRHLEVLGEKAYSMTTRQISEAMRTAEFPRFVDQIMSASMAVMSAISSSRPMADTETIASRKSICDLCENMTGGRCKLCGCSLAAKRALRNEQCPAGKW